MLEIVVKTTIIQFSLVVLVHTPSTTIKFLCDRFEPRSMKPTESIIDVDDPLTRNNLLPLLTNLRLKTNPNSLFSSYTSSISSTLFVVPRHLHLDYTEPPTAVINSSRPSNPTKSTSSRNSKPKTCLSNPFSASLLTTSLPAQQLRPLLASRRQTSSLDLSGVLSGRHRHRRDAFGLLLQSVGRPS